MCHGRGLMVSLRLFRVLAVWACTVFPAVAGEIAIAPPAEENGYLVLGFDKLGAFRFVAPAFDAAAADGTVPTGEEQIPTAVREWSGKKALVTGFMLPTKLENGLVTEFLLVKDPAMCCYGIMPNMNEWVVVQMKKGVRPLMDVPISFYGRLKVGPMVENGYLTGIYLLEGERMGEVKG